MRMMIIPEAGWLVGNVFLWGSAATIEECNDGGKRVPSNSRDHQRSEETNNHYHHHRTHWHKNQNTFLLFVWLYHHHPSVAITGAPFELFVRHRFFTLFHTVHRLLQGPHLPMYSDCLSLHMIEIRNGSANLRVIKDRVLRKHCLSFVLFLPTPELN